MSVVQLSEQSLLQIKVLAGSLDNLTNKPLKPYAQETVSFLAQLSSLILKNDRAKTLPDVISFAYWCRKANLAYKQQVFRKSAYASARLGRGLSFHIAPANIPVNFAFSYVFSLLAGNASIVRVPSKPYIQTKTLCEIIASLLPEHPEIASRTAFVSFPASDSITAELSQLADARLIWGGDTTIAHIRSLPTQPGCKDIVFSDRYSIGLIDGTAISSADSAELKRIATGFFNDTYLIDQNACSSPQMIFWLHASKESKKRFWRAVRDIALSKYDLHPQVSIDKYNKLCEDIVRDVATDKMEYESILTVVDVKDPPVDTCSLRGIGGYFYQYELTELSDLIPFINKRFQTLVYYGFDPLELQFVFLENKTQGIDRIVPIGSALDIDVIWDGYNLIDELTRIIDAR